MKKETKATLSILIKEILDELDYPYTRKCVLESAIRRNLETWIKANDLHPEQVQTFGPFTTSTNNENVTTILCTFDDSTTDWQHFKVN